MRVEDDRLVVLFDEVGYKTLGLAAVTENDLLRARRPPAENALVPRPRDDPGGETDRLGCAPLR